CIYCNVCKTLDENFKEVHCFLWPKGARHAPPDDPTGANPRWPAGGAGLTADERDGEVRLQWSRAEGAIAGYDIYRADDNGEIRCREAVKGARYVDRTVLGGISYGYYVRAYDTSGRASVPSNTVTVCPQIPDFAEEAEKDPAHV
ncbi:MAG: NADH:flavin oxidoreductase, partial [Alphaproteobacteria bacterium]